MDLQATENGRKKQSILKYGSVGRHGVLKNNIKSTRKHVFTGNLEVGPQTTQKKAARVTWTAGIIGKKHTDSAGRVVADVALEDSIHIIWWVQAPIQRGGIRGSSSVGVFLDAIILSKRQMCGELRTTE